MTLKNDLLIRACNRQPVDRPPVWIMRQAGRYLPEYRAIRSNIPFLTLCKTPDLAVEVSLQPRRILGVDAVIMFCDILISLEAMGIKLEITEKGGPKIETPIRSMVDIEKLIVPDPIETMPFVFKILKTLRQELNNEVPLIGFAGAPWTLAAYSIEGGGSKNYSLIKKMMYGEPKAFHKLMEKLANTQASYLLAQIEAGAQVIQLFDSWAGELSSEDFAEYSLPYIQSIFEQLKGKVPIILYINGTLHLLELMAKSGADVVSIDWRTDIEKAWELVNGQVALQGNLDPCRLFSNQEDVISATKRLKNKMKDKTGFIANLGHGILPQTPVENAKVFVQTMKFIDIN